jgi:hypothetical protein
MTPQAGIPPVLGSPWNAGFAPPFTVFFPAKPISHAVGLPRGVDAGGDLAYPLEGKNV